MAAQLVASGMQGVTIAKQLGVCVETVSRWRQLPDFKDAVDNMVAEARMAAIQRLRALADASLATIEASLNDTEIPAQYRLNAAFKVLGILELGEDASDAPIAQADIPDEYL
mgnify:CR=1 FL=1